MAEEEFEDNEEFEEEENVDSIMEELEQESNKLEQEKAEQKKRETTRSVPKQAIKPVKTQTSSQPPQETSIAKEEIPTDRFAAFHIPESTGIFDQHARQPYLTDMMSILADILNRLEKLEKAIG